MVRAIVAGAGGRMGGRIINMIHKTEGITLSAAFEHPDSPVVGQEP
jgi:4-hydroxy-tetrahydrodipicolinate reductase